MRRAYIALAFVAVVALASFLAVGDDDVPRVFAAGLIVLVLLTAARWLSVRT